jgi:hypothetical protein
MLSREHYALEKLAHAVETMGASPASIQQRLWQAYMSFHPVSEADFENEEDAELWQRIDSRLTSVKTGDPDRGYVQNTLDKMDDETASEIASDIFKLYFRLEHKLD